MAGEVALNRALQGLEEGLESKRPVVDGKRPLPHRLVEATHGGGFIGLARTDDDGDGRELQSTKQLEDSMAGGVLVLLIHGDGQVDHGNVDSLVLHQCGGLARGACHAAANTHRLEERGQGAGDRL